MFGLFFPFAFLAWAGDDPITAKMRSGWDTNNIVAIEAGLLLQKLGIKAVTLHARTTKQSYTGNSDWNLIKDLKKKS